jgi:selenocysteine lyase/cysteine desulfurase
MNTLLNSTRDTAASLSAARGLFPGAGAQAYIDVASRGLMLASAPQAAYDHLQQRVLGQADKAAYFAVVEAARQGVARLLNSRPDEIAITKNVSEGLNIIANALDWQAGDEVWVCPGIEHPNNLYAWRNLESRGVAVREIPSQNGELPIEAVRQALQAKHRARVLTVSGTSFLPGSRIDLDSLGELCRAHGVYLVVDGAQAVGISHLDLEKTPVDAMAMSTQKGLCSVYGMGFLYVRQSLAQTLRPQSLARFGVDIPATHEADYDQGPIVFQQGARRFDLGNYNFLAATLVKDSLDVLNRVGTLAIDDHVTRLARNLAAGLEALGAPVHQPRFGRRANIVCVQSRSGPAAAAAFQAHLKACNVQAALRRNTVRFSFHLYNDDTDVAAALAAAASWMERHGASPG